MKLSKYLADYIEHELSEFLEAGHTPEVFDYEQVVQEGIEAFESTEGWVVLVVSEETAERIRKLSE